MGDIRRKTEYYSKLIGLDGETSAALAASADRIDENGELTAIEEVYVKAGLRDRSAFDACLAAVKELAEKQNVNVFHSNAVALLSLLEFSEKIYSEAGYTTEQFAENFRDLVFKNAECLNVMGSAGTFVSGWYYGFLIAERFKLGRFQYEFVPYTGPEVSIDGETLKDGDRGIKIHIPSSGEPFDRQARLESYKEAFAFFHDKYFSEFPGRKKAFFYCMSWLLYPGHREFLPGSSRILDFMDDFKIVRFSEDERITDLWRIFGRDCEKAPAELPEKTGLQRAYKKRMTEGKKLGKGVGVFLFDGNSIVKD